MIPRGWILRLGLIALHIQLGITGCSTNTETASIRRAGGGTGDLLIRNVAVLDVATGKRVLARDVLVRDGRIHAIEETGMNVPTRSGVIEGGGGTLLPGLIDMHGHVSKPRGPSWEPNRGDAHANLRAYLYAGVTTILDPADSSGDAISRREEIANGELLGPRVYTAANMVTCPGGHPLALIDLFAPKWIAWMLRRGVAYEVETRAEAYAAVDQLADEGVDVIKVVVDHLPPAAPRISLETMKAINERANSRSLRWVAHVGSLQDAFDAGEAGASLWMHGIARERATDAEITRLADFGIPMVVTIEVNDRMLRGLNAPIDPTKLERETVPQEVLDSFFPPPHEYVEGFAAFRSGGPEGNQRDLAMINGENMMRLKKAGVSIFVGSDSGPGGIFPGASLHRELAQLVRAGMKPAEAIRAATLDPATWLANGGPLEFGAVRVGLRADLLLVRGDPTEDVKALEDLVAVIVDGTPIERRPVGAAE